MPAPIDLTGHRYGRLLVLGLANNGKSKRRSFDVRCTCGVRTVITATHLRSGHTKSCGCLAAEVKAQSLPKYSTDKMIGQKFGRLVIQSEARKHITKSGQSFRQFVVLCDCGNTKTVLGLNLIHGRIKSCGCYRPALCREANTTHGDTLHKSPTAEYMAWQNMFRRCFDPNNKSYKDYGGRGISVCKRWQNGFANFLADMGRKPTPRHSIDRKNVNGPYSPANCRWATPIEQRRNRRDAT